MKVFRVENDRGNGPYFYDTVPGIHEAHGHSKKHPGPESDPGIGYDFEYGMKFGFESREKLDKWFKGWKRMLHAEGFHIAVYKVPKKNVLVGKKQVAYRTDGISLVDTMPVVR